MKSFEIHITGELELYQKLGSWKLVSESLQITPSNFTKVKRRLGLI